MQNSNFNKRDQETPQDRDAIIHNVFKTLIKAADRRAAAARDRAKSFAAQMRK